VPLITSSTFRHRSVRRQFDRGSGARIRGRHRDRAHLIVPLLPSVPGPLPEVIIADIKGDVVVGAVDVGVTMLDAIRAIAAIDGRGDAAADRVIGETERYVSRQEG
jgi:hypothetical protein